MAQLGSSKVFGNLQVTGNIVAGTTITGTTLSISGTATAVTFSGALSGNATTATTLQTARTINLVSFNGSQNITLTKLYSIDDRTLAPADTNTRYLEFGFGAWNNNNTGPFADFLNMRSYSDSSGGNDNVLMLRKDAIGMRIYQQSFGSTTAYASYRDVAFTDSPAFTGQVVVAAGTSAAPAIAPTGDSNTGIFFPAADTIAFGEGGTEVMRINSSGQVGIGIDPTNKLHLYQNNTNQQYISISNATSTFLVGQDSSGNMVNYTNQAVNFQWSNSGTPRLTITSSGNVGIGTTSPVVRLDLGGSIGEKLNLYTGGVNRIGFGVDMGQTINGLSSFTNSAFNWGIWDGTTFTERMRLNSSGNLGIGTTNPTTKLEVAGGISLSGTLTFNGSTGSSGQVLTSQGSSAPIWTTPSQTDALAIAWLGL